MFSNCNCFKFVVLYEKYYILHSNLKCARYSKVALPLQCHGFPALASYKFFPQSSTLPPALPHVLPTTREPRAPFRLPSLTLATASHLPPPLHSLIYEPPLALRNQMLSGADINFSALLFLPRTTTGHRMKIPHTHT